MHRKCIELHMVTFLPPSSPLPPVPRNGQNPTLSAASGCKSRTPHALSPPLPHGYNGIQVVEVRLTCLRFPCYSAMLSGSFHFGNNHFRIQFSAFEDILQMLTDCRSLNPKQHTHGFLGHPYSLIPNDYLYFRTIVGRSYNKNCNSCSITIIFYTTNRMPLPSTAVV